MSIPDISFKERVNFTAVMEKANYRKSLEGLSRRWNPACIVSFPLAAAASLTRGALLCPGLCALVTSGTIFTPVQIALPMAMYLLRDCFDDSIDGDSQDVAVAYLFMEIAAQWRFELWMKVIHNQGSRDANATGFPPRLALTALDNSDTVCNAHLALKGMAQK